MSIPGRLGLSRRHMIGALGGVFIGASAGSVFAEEQKEAARSHGPWNQLGDDPGPWIDRLIMTPPEGRHVRDGISYSSRLENVIYLDLGPHAVLIDTGFHHQAGHHLKNFTTLGCDLKKVVAVLGTHSHVDHTGGLKLVRDRLGVPVVMHTLAKEPVGTGDKLQTAAVIPEVKGWEFDFPACTIDHTVEDRDTIIVGDEMIRVIHIPGHTPDSVGYLWRDHFFTGDAVFGAGLIGWASKRWLSNYADHDETMRRLVDHPVPAQWFYCAHGPDLPYGQTVPNACRKTLAGLLERADDPCNHTPRVNRRADDAQARTLKLA